MSFRRPVNRESKVQPVSELGVFGALESFIYEIKPIFYTLFSILILRSTYSQDSLVKFAAVGIFIFSAIIIYARLYNRGYIK